MSSSKAPKLPLAPGVEDGTKKSSAGSTDPARGLEIGETGTKIFSGFIREEYNAKLQGIEGIKVYDEMRKSDGTVQGMMRACTLPVRRAKWLVNPGSDEAADEEIQQFVTKALFDLQSIKWDDILRQALLALPLGVMLFEKVFTIANVDGKDRVIWDKFAPRLAKSVLAWQMRDGGAGIQQILVKGGIVDIPEWKLLYFINEREGDNYWGSPMLRAAYKHWYIKNNLYKIDAIAAERQGLGIPKVKMPLNYTEEDRSKAETILKNIRANEHAFVIEPYDYEISFMDMMSSTTRDLQPAISHHNREMSKSILAQFLELGSAQHGSQALSTDQTDLFLQSEEAVGNMICDTINPAIKELVDLNFNDVENYPTLAYAGISRIDVAGLATTYQTFVTAGAIKAGPSDEPYLRELMGMPERDQSDDPTPEEQAQLDADAKAAQDKIAQNNPDDPANKNKKEMSDKGADAKKKIRGAGGACGHEAHASFSEGDVFKSWRKLTFAEEKVNWDALQTKLDELEEGFDATTQDLLHAERDQFVSDLTKALAAGDKNAVKEATLNVKAAYAKIIKDAMNEAFEYGKTTASREMGVKVPPNPREVLSQIDIQADAIADQHISQITADAKNAMVTALSKGESNAVALAAADTAASDSIDELTSNTSSIVLSGSVNNGRSAAFDANSENIYALQRSEILDSATCNYCLSVDGRIVEKDDPFAQNTIFHSNCRGIWVEIMLSEEDLPPIGGIPQSIKDRFGNAVNDLIQPKVPQTKANTLARKEVERRAKRKAARQ